MKRNAILIIFLIVGFLILLFNEKIVDYVDSLLSGPDNRPTIATITLIEGRPRVKKAKTLKFKNGYSNQDLKDQDTLITDETSSARIAFKSGFEIQVQPNSLIVIEQPSRDALGRIQITFLQGEFKVLKTGDPGQVIISKDRKFQDLAGRPAQNPLQISLEDKTIAAPEPPVEAPALPVAIEPEVLDEKKKIFFEPPKKAPRKTKETLADEYIAQIIATQKPFFERCYTQHLRLNPDSKGLIHLAFTISPQGKVSSVSLIESTLKDPQLEKCTMNVIERCRFKNFDGDPIVVNYPINFE